ncbi:RNA polymerase sigma factor [Fodinibius salsisoli]|uniref:Sigma-70 family RNA polymerase sigma factor n=1 Tax=Fodinibius salsisoli TaxID=2820877 RepID=A0ABT3PJF9_9BACT|nr:sigma-70 family RNA polymerase sigma factor [Fodinibius salsisoli]MCW9706080.1 sigma-70 family RNA polymerase sigma factor [Fodinibius salsisoli]
MDSNKGKMGNGDAVWDRFVQGDESCFRRLFKIHFDSMYGYGIKLCSRPELVRDCIQELFKTLWERRDELEHIESPNVYLFVSLRRKIITRQKAQRKLDGDLEEVDEGKFTQFAREEIIIKDEVKFQQKEELKKALNQLSDRQKEVIFLHFYNGMSYREIEQILSINRQSVRNHIYRGMETLRSILDTEIMKLVISLLVTFLLFV